MDIESRGGGVGPQPEHAPSSQANAFAYFSDCPMCLVALDSDNRPCQVNAAFEEYMGPLYKFRGFGFGDAPFEEEGKAKLKAAISSARDHGSQPASRRVRNLEMLSLAADGGLPIRKHFDWTCGLGADGSVVLFGEPCSEGDVEQRARDSELVDFFQNAPIAMHWLSSEGIILWANQTELDVLGYTAEEYIGQSVMKFCPDEEALVLEIFKQLGSGNTIRDVPVRFRTKDGRIVDLLIDSNVKYDVKKDGVKEFGHTRCFIRDDTKRKVREARTRLLLDETKRSLELLDNFMARVVHHLKEPLHVLLMSSSLVADKLRKAQDLGKQMVATVEALSSGEGEPPDVSTAAALASSLSPSSSSTPTVCLSSAGGIGAAAAAAVAAAEQQATALAKSMDMVSQAEGSVGRTLQLLEDVGDLMKAEADGPETAFTLRVAEQVDLATVGREALASMDPSQPGVACELVIGGGGASGSPTSSDVPLVVSTDPVLLKRALVHLLNNAAVATTAGKITLLLSVDEASGRPLIVVEDTGPGLPQSAAAAELASVTSVGASESEGGASGASAPSDATNSTASGGGSGVVEGSSGSASNGVGVKNQWFERYHQELLSYEVDPSASSYGGSVLDEAAAQASRNLSLSRMSSRTTQSLGLGLSLTYQLVQALGGEMNYSSTSSSDASGDIASGSRSGTGTRFWFSLPDIPPESTPATKTAAAGDCPVEAPQRSSSSDEDKATTSTTTGRGSSAGKKRKAQSDPENQEEDSDAAGGAGATSAAKAEALATIQACKRFQSDDPLNKVLPGAVASRGLESGLMPHVLVIEDSAVCAKLICMQLRKLECSYAHAENGQAALELLRDAAPGMFTLVLCDLRMPVMDGFEASKLIRAEFKGLPIVALSGETGWDTKTLVEDGSFDAFVPKPVKKQALKAVVATHSAPRFDRIKKVTSIHSPRRITKEWSNALKTKKIRALPV